jgi:hypothetical protein
MVLIAFAGGLVVAGVVGYLKNKSFRTKVQADVSALQIEVLNVRTKLTSGVAVVEADWEKAKTLFSSLTSKL